ncbi:MAG: transketolase [Acidobacteriota bacterium]
MAAQLADMPQLTEERLKALEIMARRLRRHSLLSTTEAGSGHPSTCFSCAEIVAAIFFQFLRYDLQNPKHPANDRFVLSKGHAAPILWAVLAEAGAFPVDKLLTLRRIDSELEGHPTPRSPYVDVATGSLGQGLSNAVGMAIAAKMDGLENRIYALLGDGETAEGSVWEAAALAAHRKLSNLVAVVDVNRLGQSEPTMYQHHLEVYRQRFEAFGWKVWTVDGHDIPALVDVLAEATAYSDGPAAVIAKTLKGKGVSFMEDKEGWHGKPVTDPDQVRQALEELGPDEPLPEALELRKPSGAATISGFAGVAAEPEPPQYSLGQQVATREAYGTALAKLGKVNPRIVALDGDCKNSTFSQTFMKAFPERFIECYIAEQNMVGAAAGLAAVGKIPFASSFACFLSRAYDFIRMAGISQVNLKLCGSHAGVSIGEDGPSQMGLEDLAMMRAVAGSTVLYPCDAVSTERLVALAAKTPGIVYIRTSRPKTPVIYKNDETFEVGGSKVVRKSDRDQATIVAAGVTLHEALAAADELAKEGISVRVIDLYSVKPVDRKTLEQAARETGLIVTVEDHYAEGGLGEAARGAVDPVIPCRWVHLAVRELPRSGKPAELLERCGISANRIAAAVREALR